MNEKQIIDFLITQSEILGLPKENCPYYQIIEFIAKDKEKINKLIRYIALKEGKDFEKVKEEFEI